MTNTHTIYNTARNIFSCFIFCLGALICQAQEVPILSYAQDNNGRVLLEIEGNSEEYYLLHVRHSPEGDFVLASSMTIGVDGPMYITEGLENYPIDYYSITAHSIANPNDYDQDGIDDITEYYNMPDQNPLNSAATLEINNGLVAVNSLTTFKALSVVKESVMWSTFLNDMEYVKFVIEDIDSIHPKVHFANSETHTFHKDFMDAVGIDYETKEVTRGEVVYHPSTVAANGTLGVFAFNYSVGFGLPFPTVQKTHELLAASMPFLKNNLSYFVVTSNIGEYEEIAQDVMSSRIPVLFQSEIFADVDYLALNVAESYGYFKLTELDETPNSRDIVLFESVPNTLPRVGGIMTSFIQTPLSHVNLRAIQDNIPNSFVRNPMEIDSITSLLDKYVYYRADQNTFHIREASIEEVNLWYEDIRPDKNQIPALNLDYTEILPLDEISFDMADGFGAKCANVATMRTFGFPEHTIPNGFGIPFYYYQEFMQHNGFFEEIALMIEDENFQNNLETRIEKLEELRERIEDADMPQWMLDDLADMQASFPEGTSIRCRSSTNNEDLPGFSGAGLYNSKTQHPDEGHISKSVKQVYASMWNFRAYDERDFYRVDNYVASMGILCHPNFNNEKANGVGVSTDPIYQTDNTFYLNTQVGEDLVTNPGALSVPEEILLDKVSVTEDDYVVIRTSNLVTGHELILSDEHLDEMRDYLNTIHDNFQELYNAESNPTFAMDIEYKIKENNQLVIKQARPWATYWSLLGDTYEDLKSKRAKLYPNPAYDGINIECECAPKSVEIYNLNGQKITEKYTYESENKTRIPIASLAKGIYFAIGKDEAGTRLFIEKFVKY